MSRRTVAGLLAIGLIAVGVVLGTREPSPFVKFSPGPTVNVLGQNGDKKIVEITGHKTYEDDGALRLVTVYVTPPSDDLTLLETLIAWADRDVAVLPHSIYDPNETNESSREESAAEMTSSQDSATAAALSALGIKFSLDRVVQVQVSSVVAKGPSDGVLKAGDVLAAIDGVRVTGSKQLIAEISAKKPGTEVKVGIARAGSPETVKVRTAPNPEDPKKSRIGISLAPEKETIKAKFPFKVDINLDENIGGPSAGMMFALSIYDVLTPGSLTGGKTIAGSGEISADGVVGPIGGIGQKLVAAQRDGAKLFLVAQENCAEAAKAHYDKDKMRLVKVHKLKDAIGDIEAWRENPKADLPGCS